MTINFTKHIKLGVAVSIWEDRDEEQTVPDKSKRSGGKLKRK